MEEDKKLSNQQKKFCEEYIKDWNAARSARDAGYSEKTAKEQGCQLLTKLNIQAYLKEIQEDLQKQAGISRLSNVAVLKNIIDDIQAEPRDRMKAIEVTNKMLGFNAPEQTESKNAHTHKGIAPITWVNDSTK
jgi:phage terminase small subunit